jgi:hypothetical protein
MAPNTASPRSSHWWWLALALLVATGAVVAVKFAQSPVVTTAPGAAAGDALVGTLAGTLAGTPVPAETPGTAAGMPAGTGKPAGASIAGPVIGGLVVVVLIMAILPHANRRRAKQWYQKAWLSAGERETYEGVRRDIEEQSGEKAFLNWGHTRAMNTIYERRGGGMDRE